MKLLGKRSAGKSHATFDEAGDGNRTNSINYCAIARPYLRGGRVSNDPLLLDKKLVIFVCLMAGARRIKFQSKHIKS